MGLDTFAGRIGLSKNPHPLGEGGPLKKVGEGCFGTEKLRKLVSSELAPQPAGWPPSP